MSELVSIEDHGRVRHLILDRPEKRNAFNRDLVLALREAAREAADDHEVHCVVLRGEGAAFSAGIDIFELAGLAGTENLRPFRRDCIEAANLLEEMTKPVVAQIHGACLGLGAELALACDLRVMADDVKFGLPETKLGLIPDVGGSSRLPAVVGLGIAKELLMTGRSIGAAECHRIGAANRVAAVADLEAVTQELVDELLAASPLAVGFAKRVADGVAKPTLAASLEQEVSFQQILVATDDFREAGAAYMEKRPANFTGAPPGATKRVPEAETA
jgi:enoyl-CoA hydratase/carnithine racemase